MFSCTTAHNLFFTITWPCCTITNFFTIKPTICTNFPNLLWHVSLHVSCSFSVHHQQLIHCTLSNGISHRSLGSFTVGSEWKRFPSWYCSKAVFWPIYIYQWINSWWWTENLPETRRFSCRSKFGKLVHLVGYIMKKAHKMSAEVLWSIEKEQLF